jgi:flavin-dependent dehydrogenase
MVPLVHSSRIVLGTSLTHDRRRSRLASARPGSDGVEGMFRRLEDSPGSAGGAGGSTSYDAFTRLDEAWKDMKERKVYGLPPRTVKTTKEALPCDPGLDVLVGGGTLGIFLAAALQAQGLKTGVIERGSLRGRDQDWNVSREELMEFVKGGVLTETQAEACITIEFNPIKAGFQGFDDIETENVLNLGVSPRELIRTVKENYVAAGGVVLEQCQLEKVWVHPNGVSVRFHDLKEKQNGNRTSRPKEELAMASKLFIDSMGNQSPIVRQIRHGTKPDGVCMVVGSCCGGFDESLNKNGDIIRTIGPSEDNVQLFWEAFPAGSSPTDRTTYMFSYMDADPRRPSFHEFMEEYWKRLPGYQNIDLEDLQVKRILFGLFPTYRDAPLAPQWDRILQVGDAGGLQSPLSFGGFTALARHVGRLTRAIVDAVDSDCLDQHMLRYVNPYNPSLSSTWMFQKAMSIPAGETTPNNLFINRLLGGNFKIMAQEKETLKPFLQDVIMAKELTTTLVNVMKTDPLFVPVIMSTVGLPALVDWLGHYLLLVLYSFVSAQATKHAIKDKIDTISDKKVRFVFRRALERWKYGSGLDYFNE